MGTKSIHQSHPTTSPKVPRPHPRIVTSLLVRFDTPSPPGDPMPSCGYSRQGIPQLLPKEKSHRLAQTIIFGHGSAYTFYHRKNNIKKFVFLSIYLLKGQRNLPFFILFHYSIYLK